MSDMPEVEALSADEVLSDLIGAANRISAEAPPELAAQVLASYAEIVFGVGEVWSE